MKKNYYVYILSNYKRTTLYTGFTSNLKRRVYEHSQGKINGFTKKYKIKYLIYYEVFKDVNDAIYREKFIKGKKRSYKLNLIHTINPNWQDLSENIF